MMIFIFIIYLYVNNNTLTLLTLHFTFYGLYFKNKLQFNEYVDIFYRFSVRSLSHVTVSDNVILVDNIQNLV